MFDELVISFAIGAAGYLIGNVLNEPGEFFGWLPALVQRLTGTRKKTISEYNWAQWWISKITYLCGKCIAGNMAMAYVFFTYCFFSSLDFGEGFIMVALSVFFAFAIERNV